LESTLQHLTFHSTRIDVKDKTHAVLYGDLIIRDLPHEVALDVEFNGLAKSPWGTTHAGFIAKAQLKRKGWGLNWNVALETGGWLVGDDIHISVSSWRSSSSLKRHPSLRRQAGHRRKATGMAWAA
jgi:polyisoprenoid-binding protein YceI